ncbi:hypothetical protein RJT34_21941 [Clitoria ternatea]|uniref:Uncharacterized protein n=1 Tax=Clitoria ternatea TaxID=43366 RepID=A0AAN9P644_CLITE
MVWWLAKVFWFPKFFAFVLIEGLLHGSYDFINFASMWSMILFFKRSSISSVSLLLWILIAEKVDRTLLARKDLSEEIGIFGEVYKSLT